MSRHVLISAWGHSSYNTVLLSNVDRQSRYWTLYHGKELTFSKSNVSNAVFDWCLETGFIPKYRSYPAAVRLSFKDEVEASLFRMAFGIDGRSRTGSV